VIIEIVLDVPIYLTGSVVFCFVDVVVVVEMGDFT